MWPDCAFRWDTEEADHTHRCIEPDTHEDEHICDCGEREGHEDE